MGRRSRRGFAEGFARRYKPRSFEERAIKDALRPREQTGSNLKTLADMTPEERAALEQQYGAKIKSPK